MLVIKDRSQQRRLVVLGIFVLVMITVIGASVTAFAKYIQGGPPTSATYNRLSPSPTPRVTSATDAQESKSPEPSKSASPTPNPSATPILNKSPSNAQRSTSPTPSTPVSPQPTPTATPTTSPEPSPNPETPPE